MEMWGERSMQIDPRATDRVCNSAIALNRITASLLSLPSLLRQVGRGELILW